MNNFSLYISIHEITLQLYESTRIKFTASSNSKVLWKFVLSFIIANYLRAKWQNMKWMGKPKVKNNLKNTKVLNKTTTRKAGGLTTNILNQ